MDKEFSIKDLDLSKIKSMKFCVDKKFKASKYSVFDFVNPNKLSVGHTGVDVQIARKALKKALIVELSEGFVDKDKERIKYINEIFDELEKIEGFKEI